MRELRNVVYRAYVMTPGRRSIVDDCLPDERRRRRRRAAGAPTLTIRVGTPLAEVERQLTLATLEHFGRHKEKTAATLGISLKTLYNRLKEYAERRRPDQRCRARSTRCAERACDAGPQAARLTAVRAQPGERVCGSSGFTRNESKPAASARSWSSRVA